MEKIIKIGTRDSKLAIWQAEFVKEEFKKIGIKSEIVFIKSEGDQNTKTPLYEMGIEGIFTKTLDIALLDGKIDIAVHSLKDVPTKLALGIIIAGVPKRGDYKDILVFKGKEDFHEKKEYIIGTSSLRRKAYLLNKFPNFKTENLRGNIQKRFEKIEKNHDWKGAIFAKVALERLGIKLENYIDLDFMLPAPSQGALGIACLEKNKEVIELCKKINHKETEICVGVERKFLNLLNGGCSMPIGALAKINGDKISFSGSILSIDGKEKYEVFVKDKLENAGLLGEKAYKKLIGNKKTLELIKKIR